MSCFAYCDYLPIFSSIEEFNRKILNPDLEHNDLVNLYKEAWDLFSVYFRPDSPDRINFGEDIVEEMRQGKY